MEILASTYLGPSAHSKAVAKRRDDEIDAAKLDGPADIPNLPWMGNYACDARLFSRIEELERRLVAAGDREGVRQAAILASKHGMGIDTEVSDAELDEYIECLA